ncbi:MAG: hypothetical protein NTW87_17650 [Planctomycetota bacterium]|nr:hypothetical protein [Planctomycetota bacterium]
MSYRAARIESPDVIKDFRTHFIKFDEVCRTALTAIRTECQQVLQWLQYEQIAFLKQELRKAEEAVIRARTEYLLVRDGSSAYGKPSCLDEQKALRKAERRKEEVDRKLQLAKKWAMLLDRETSKLMGPVNNLSTMLEVNTPKAIAKLDFLVRNLEDYLRTAPPDVGVPGGAGGLDHGR